MNAQNKDQAKQRTQMLVDLRKQHGEKVKQVQALLKAQQTVRKTLQRAMQEGPRSVPNLAAAASISPSDVLWHIAAMKKYGLVEEAGMDEHGEYYLYALSKETKP